MIALMQTYKNMISIVLVVTLVLGLYFYIHSLKSQIGELQNTLKDAYIEKANYQLEVQRYKSVLDTQNSHIQALEASEALNKAKLRKWQNKKPEVKYRTITKLREVHSNDCKKIKSVIDDIRHIDYDSLY